MSIIIMRLDRLQLGSGTNLLENPFNVLQGVTMCLGIKAEETVRRRFIIPNR